MRSRPTDRRARHLGVCPLCLRRPASSCSSQSLARRAAHQPRARQPVAAVGPRPQVPRSDADAWTDRSARPTLVGQHPTSRSLESGPSPPHRTIDRRRLRRASAGRKSSAGVGGCRARKSVDGIDPSLHASRLHGLVPPVQALAGVRLLRVPSPPESAATVPVPGAGVDAGSRYSRCGSGRRSESPLVCGHSQSNASTERDGRPLAHCRGAAEPPATN